MKLGFSTMEAVASQLIWDIIETGPDKWKSITRLTPLQTYEKVINRRESVAMSSIPAYVWGELVFERGQEETKETDFFGSPIMRDYCELTCALDLGNYQQGVWAKNERSGVTRNIRYNIVADECANSGNMGKLFAGGDLWSEESIFEHLTYYGLKDNQRFLMRIVADWHVDYFGEGDIDWQQELLFAEPAEMTEEWMQWLLDEAANKKEQIERRQQRDARMAERQDARKFLDDIAAGKSKSKLRLAGTQAHADAVAKKGKPGIFGR